MITQLQAGLAHRGGRAEAAFNDTLNARAGRRITCASRPPRRAGRRDEPGEVAAFYKDRFADLSDFTFVFVGSVDVPTLKPLVERYMASLPSLNRQEKGRDRRHSPPDASVEKVGAQRARAKSQVSVIFSGPFVNTPRERLTLRAHDGRAGRQPAATCCARAGRDLRRVSVSRSSPAPGASYPWRSPCRRPARTDAAGQGAVRDVSRFKTTRPRTSTDGRCPRRAGRDYEVTARRTLSPQPAAYAYEHGEDWRAWFDRRPLHEQLTSRRPHRVRRAAIEICSAT